MEVIVKAIEDAGEWRINWVSMNDTMEIEDESGFKQKIIVQAWQ